LGSKRGEKSRIKKKGALLHKDEKQISLNSQTPCAITWGDRTQKGGERKTVRSGD